MESSEYGQVCGVETKKGIIYSFWDTIIPLHIMDANGVQDYSPLHKKHVTLKLKRKAFLERNRRLLETVPTNIKYWFEILKSKFYQKTSFLS